MQEFQTIPTIDISGIIDGKSDTMEFQNAAKSIDDACRNVGFFYITNHGVPQEKIDRVFKEALDFFELPLESKQEVSMSKSTDHRGYFGIGEENVDDTQPEKDLKEGFDLSLDLGPDDPEVKRGVPFYGSNQWPKELGIDWQDHMTDYLNMLLNLGRKLMKAFAINLKLEENYFQKMYEKPIVLLRLLKYPPQSERMSDKQLGCGVHTDYGFLTILAQDQLGGLQVKNRQGMWIDAKPIPGSFVVNLGDMMAVATRNIYRATPHRVQSPISEKSRVSIPLFFDPHYDTLVSCFKSCRDPADKDDESKYPAVCYGRHLEERYSATFTYAKKEDEK